MFTHLSHIDSQHIVAIDENLKTLTYKELNTISDDLANIIPSRSLVFSFCSNELGSVSGYASFISNKIVPLLLESTMDTDLILTLEQTYTPNYVWAPKDMTGFFSKFPIVYEVCDYVLYELHTDSLDLYPELALLITTSGSTGSPKLVRQSYKNLLANTNSIIEYLDITNTERAITTLPMNYVYGLSIVNTHLITGATLLFTTKSVMQKEFWDFFKEQKATSFGGVPYTYEMLKRLKFLEMDLPDLRTFTQAGGKLPAKLHLEYAEYAKKYNKQFVVMYGAAEATSRMGYLPADMSIEKCGSIGIPIPDGEFFLYDENKQLITENNTVGELVYKGDNVTLGYATSLSDLKKGDERSGILFTGDMSKRDDDSYYYIVGRKNRFLKIFGNRVNLDETEQLLKAQFPNIECACVGVDDSMSVYVTDNNNLNTIREFLSEKTKLHFSCFKIKFIEEIPKNGAGKTLYNKLEQSNG